MASPTQIPLTAEEIRTRRTPILITSTIVLLFLGLIYAFSMFSAPMAEAFGLDRAALGTTFNIMMICFCLGGIVGAYIERALSLRADLIISGLLFMLGFAGTGLFGFGNLVAVYLLYGVAGGLGVGCAYSAIIGTTNVWFPDKTGFSSGILMMGFGVSALVLGNIALSLVPALGMPGVLVVLGIVGGFVTIAGSFIIAKAPSNVAQIMSGNGSGGEGLASSKPAHDPADDDKPLSKPIFYLYWVWVIILNCVGLAVVGNCASDAQLAGLSAAFATLLVGLVSVANGCARILFGMVADKVGIKRTMQILALVAIVATACVCAALVTHAGVLYVIGALLCGMAYGGTPVISSAYTRARFGAANLSLNFALVNFSLVVASLLNILLTATVAASGNRGLVFAVMLGLAVVAALDLIPFGRVWDADMADLERRRAS